MMQAYRLGLTVTALWAFGSGCGTSWTPEDFRAALLDPEHGIWDESAPAVFDVRFETSKGDLVLQAHREWAPTGVDRFYNLVRSGFYDDSRFYRVRAGFIVQFGLPGDPAVTAVWYERAMPDDPVVQSNTKGLVAYAMTGPDTRTTQLYINLDDNTQLDEQGFAPIGSVISGMDVVEQLYAEYDEGAGGGMRAGNQGKIVAGGNAHLDAEFPNLDRLIRATIVEEY
jgi:cyclophilin family peptidyl-prolyl cis-trans isomerase